MDDLTDAEIEAAQERGRIEMATKPRARTARYDRATGRVHVELVNGCEFFFPARLVQGLEDASDEELAEVEVFGAGFALHWEMRDTDVTVEGLMAGRFGSRAYMARRFGTEWAQAAE